MGQHAERGDTAACLELGAGATEQRPVAPEAIDDESPDQRRQLVRQDPHRPVEVREDAAPLDVAHQDGGDAGPPGQAEVHDVVAQQVDLRRAARTLADDHVEAGPQRGQCVVDHTE